MSDGIFVDTAIRNDPDICILLLQSDIQKWDKIVLCRQLILNLESTRIVQVRMA